MGDPCQGTSTVRTAAEAMLVHPKVCAPSTTIAQAREMFVDDHVHALLIVDDRWLVAVVERADLASATHPNGPAGALGRLQGRTVPPDAPLAQVLDLLLEENRRRMAVVTAEGQLLGLLCLKRSGRGFCTDANVAARSAERALSTV